MNKVVLRQHQGRSFFYTHAICMQAGKFYQTVPLADIAPDAVCVECGELLHDEAEEENILDPGDLGNVGPWYQEE